jgi:predicted glycoside hydrolase/deacetylase ChbG (UPF0249 family)
MLIINADDFGRDRCATDRATACFKERRITSTTAMVFMSDSERAAGLAHDVGVPVGLHINFSQPFTATSVPPPLVAAHSRVARFLKRNKHALLFFHPTLPRDFRHCFEAQLSEFLRIFGQPSHFDGHQHLHLATNVLASGILPRGAKVRRSFTFAPGEKGMVNRAYRRVVDGILARRHLLTDYFFSLADYLAPERLEKVVTLSTRANVELMTHPALEPEFEFLMSDVFRDAIARTHLESYMTFKRAS